MIKSSKDATITILSCPLLNYWISFRFVNEHGDGAPYAGLRYTLHDSQGQKLAGTLNDDGFARVEGCHCGPVILDISAQDTGELDPWYKRLIIRKSFRLPLTALQIAAEQSTSGPRRADGKTYLAEARALQEDALFFRVEVSDFAE